MKTVTQIEEASLSSGLETTAMGMVLNATSFNHIINSLYKNPLGAILRELTTNALESHMVAKTTRKVAIQLPTALDQSFVIRDFGTGLDDKEVQKYLNTLFSTSKDKDNNLMGGFGLGSKSPLALVDTFNIISIKNGLKNNYAWIKEPGKLPSLVHLDDDEDRNEETDEDDGIKIVIPLGSSTKISQSRLQQTVEEEARRQLLGFSDKIMFVDNINVKHYQDLKDITKSVIKETLVLDLEHVALFRRDADTYYPSANTMLIMIGGVNYPFADMYRQYVQSLFKYFVNANSEYIVCLKAPIGALELPMSREEILTIVQNEKVLSEAAKAAAQDIAEHIKSLNINLDVSLVDFYKQLKNVTSKLKISNGVQFNLEITQQTFESKDKPLQAFLEKMRKSSACTSRGRDLAVNTLTGDRLPSRLIQSYTETGAMTVNIYDKYGSREKFSNGYGFNIHSRPRSYLVTTSPLPNGVSHNLLHSYVTEKLKIKHDLVLIQMDTSLHADFAEVYKVIEAHSNYFLTDSSEYLGVLDTKLIQDYKEEVRLLNKSAGRASYTRATVDYIPGARIAAKINPNNYNFFITAGLLNLTFSDTKITALEDIDGKRIPIGPDYVEAGKKVLLTTNGTLPIDLQAFTSATSVDVLTTDKNIKRKHPDAFNRLSQPLFTPLKDFIVLKVASASFAGCLKRLEDAKIKVYTHSNPFVLERPTINDIPPVDLGKQLLRTTLDKYTNQLGLWSRSHDYISKTTVEAISNILPTIISDPLYLKACQATIDSCKNSIDIFRLYPSSLEEYKGYDQKVIDKLADSLSLALVNEVTSAADTELNRHLFDLVGSGLKKEVFNKIISNLITVAAKGNKNEIQTPIYSTT